MRLIRFSPQTEHVPGKQMVVADALSRSPCKLEQEPDTVEDVQAFVGLVESTRPATGDQLKKIREDTIRPDHGKTDTYYPPDTDQSFRAKTSKPYSSKKG